VKNFFVSFLVLNLLLEGMAAGFLIAGPQGVLSDVQTPDGILWSANYGFGAMAIASAIFWIWPHRGSRAAVASVLGILMTFHALVFVSFAMQGNHLSPMMAHGVMAVVAIFLYTQRSRFSE
jgi:hypothetical protein